MIAFYIIGMSMKTLRNPLFVDSTDSIIEKMTVMQRTATEEMACLKRCFGTFPTILHLKRRFAKKEVRIVVMAQREA
jgi:hypothetical protein